MDTNKGLLTGAEVDEICRIWAAQLYAEDGGELLTACMGAAREDAPELTRAELLAETVRRAYVLGFRDGVTAVSEAWEDEPEHIEKR